MIFACNGHIAALHTPSVSTTIALPGSRKHTMFQIALAALQWRYLGKIRCLVSPMPRTYTSKLPWFVVFFQLLILPLSRCPLAVWHPILIYSFLCTNGDGVVSLWNTLVPHAVTKIGKECAGFASSAMCATTLFVTSSFPRSYQ